MSIVVALIFGDDEKEVKQNTQEESAEQVKQEEPEKTVKSAFPVKKPKRVTRSISVNIYDDLNERIVGQTVYLSHVAYGIFSKWGGQDRIDIGLKLTKI
ncbi:hypothetical protein Barb4_04904 [Bacteroidales bacterium Barb4]|nr:hypothetical protein Barb4_04904 [Bacteroidales bacterium Barb4]